MPRVLTGGAEAAALPRPVDFHLHFEGCIFPATLEKLGGEPREFAFDPATGFYGFLDTLKRQLGILKTERAFNFALDGFIDYLRGQKLSRCEFFFSPLIYDKTGLGSATALQIFASRTKELPPDHVMIFDTVRQFGPGAAEQVVALAADWRGRLPVAGIGMGGDENAIPAREFRPAFDEARKLGLGLTCHAGEIGDPRAIWEAIDTLGATRIGHGLAAANDAALMARMKKDGIAIECSPASNIKLGLVKSISEHPLHAFIKAGIDLLPGADDPAIFGEDSKSQYELLAKYCGGERLMENAKKHAFMQDVEKS